MLHLLNHSLRWKSLKRHQHAHVYGAYICMENKVKIREKVQTHSWLGINAISLFWLSASVTWSVHSFVLCFYWLACKVTKNLGRLSKICLVIGVLSQALGLQHHIMSICIPLWQSDGPTFRSQNQRYRYVGDPLSELNLKSFGFQTNIKIAVISICEHTALKHCLTPALMKTVLGALSVTNWSGQCLALEFI